MWRILIFVVVVLYIIYTAMTLLQAFGVIKFTNRKITTGRMFIPFYYWIASYDEKK
jgi:hypothetical protein